MDSIIPQSQEECFIDIYGYIYNIYYNIYYNIHTHAAAWQQRVDHPVFCVTERCGDFPSMWGQEAYK